MNASSSLTYRERRELKAERYREWAEKREAKAAAAGETAHQFVGMIPFGQPILVGHHSQRRHERHMERVGRLMDRTVENGRKAEEFNRRADSIEAAAANAIYSDDPDAKERLAEKLAALEAKREEMKARNATYKREHKAELKVIDSAYMRNRALPHPSYELTNLGGNISRLRKRLAAMS